MKAIVCTQYGPPDLLELKEVPTPLPADDEVLIKLYAASINPLDSFTIRGLSALLPIVSKMLKPKQPLIGADIAGRVEVAGRLVKTLRPGDEVFGALFGGKGSGAFSEYACATEDKLAPKPRNLSFEQAAAVPIAAITALQGLRDKGHIQSRHKVLVDGASGGVGTFAVQIAKAFGAEVTAVCSTRNLEIARSIGADHVIDYTQADFTQGGLRYDLIFGANAHHSPFAYRRALRPKGTFVLAGGGTAQIFQGMLLQPLLSRLGSRKLCFFIAKINATDLVFLKDLLESGMIVPVIDRSYPLSETAAALKYREEGHAQGKIVLTITH